MPTTCNGRNYNQKLHPFSWSFRLFAHKNNNCVKNNEHATKCKKRLIKCQQLNRFFGEKFSAVSTMLVVCLLRLMVGWVETACICYLKSFNNFEWHLRKASAILTMAWRVSNAAHSLQCPETSQHQCCLLAVFAPWKIHIRKKTGVELYEQKKLLPLRII